MNIFYIDTDVDKCAESHCNKHVVKMILEYAQLLSTAHVELDGNQVAYKSTHKNHPCAVWVRQSSDNYRYLYNLFVALCKEYTHRYDKVHLTWTKHGNTLAHLPSNINTGEFTLPPQCMPEDYYHNDTVQAYRSYYRHGKSSMLEYKRRQIPSWVIKC